MFRKLLIWFGNTFYANTLTDNLIINNYHKGLTIKEISSKFKIPKWYIKDKVKWCIIK